MWRLSLKEIKVRGAAVWLEIGLGLGFFCVFFKLPLLFVRVENYHLYVKYCLVPNLVPQLFFCKFDFSYFFRFVLSTSIRMRKIDDFKNNALQVERAPKIFENLNYFETMLKMLKTMQIYLKNIFFGFLLFLVIFGFFKNFIK